MKGLSFERHVNWILTDLGITEKNNWEQLGKQKKCKADVGMTDNDSLMVFKDRSNMKSEKLYFHGNIYERYLGFINGFTRQNYKQICKATGKQIY